MNKPIPGDTGPCKALKGKALYCFDAGKDEKLGWARQLDDERKCGIGLETLVCALVEDLNAGKKVVLGIEAPLYLPVANVPAEGTPVENTKARPGEARQGSDSRPWSTGIGSSAATVGLVSLCYLVQELFDKAEIKPSDYEILDPLDHETRQKRLSDPEAGSVFLWEACVSVRHFEKSDADRIKGEFAGPAKQWKLNPHECYDMADCAAALEDFNKRFDEPNDFGDDGRQNISLVGSALSWLHTNLGLGTSDDVVDQVHCVLAKINRRLLVRRLKKPRLICLRELLERWGEDIEDTDLLTDDKKNVELELNARAYDCLRELVENLDDNGQLNILVNEFNAAERTVRRAGDNSTGLTKKEYVNGWEWVATQSGECIHNFVNGDGND